MLYDDTVILVFAKAPVAGKVNTRLIPDIGVRAATQLQQDLIHDRLSMLKRADQCAVKLMCAPDIRHECFTRCEKQYPISLVEQVGDDLGEKMFNGVVGALQKYKYCIVIGTDAPALDEEMIEQVLAALHRDADVVFVPAEDGGYVLIAMKHAYPFLFQAISWGSEDVMQQSRDKLNENNVLFEEFSCCWDIDRLKDYQRYQALKLTE